MLLLSRGKQIEGAETINMKVTALHHQIPDELSEKGKTRLSRIQIIYLINDRSSLQQGMTHFFHYFTKFKSLTEHVYSLLDLDM